MYLCWTSTDYNFFEHKCAEYVLKSTGVPFMYCNLVYWQFKWKSKYCIKLTYLCSWTTLRCKAGHDKQKIELHPKLVRKRQLYSFFFVMWKSFFYILLFPEPSFIFSSFLVASKMLFTFTQYKLDLFANHRFEAL